MKIVLQLVNIWHSYKQERDCFMHFFRLLAVCWPNAQVHETITFLLVTLSNIHQLKFFFTLRLSNKPFLIWLLTNPSHLKYVATLPCNLSSMACFADDNVSQGSVATCARCGGIFEIHLTANSLRNLPVKKILKSVKNWQNYGHESVAPFFGPPCTSTIWLLPHGRGTTSFTPALQLQCLSQSYRVKTATDHMPLCQQHVTQKYRYRSW